MLKKKCIARVLVISFIALLLFSIYRAGQLIAIGSAYTAKILCSSHFISKRSIDDIRGQELGVDDLAMLKHFTAQVDDQQQRVSASLWGLGERHALYEPERGCYLDLPAALATPMMPDTLKPAPVQIERTPLPISTNSDVIDQSSLQQVIDAAFIEPNPNKPRRTRAIVILHQGKIIAEKYANGFHADMPLLGWSMSKSVLNALIGIQLQQGKLCLDCATGLKAWQGRDDQRKTITIEQLLQMQSGLDFGEDYSDPLGDVTRMLLTKADMAGFAADKALIHQPGEHWSYSSGSSNILASLLREPDELLEVYWRYPYAALFHPLGMTSAVWETDSTGHFVGSSYLYASARDWARLGQLYLNDGIWNGERLLPEGWVEYSTTAARHAPAQQYGAHFWLKLPAPYRDTTEKLNLPADSFHAVGHEGQFVSIIPSQQLVVVRLGLSRLPGSWNHAAFLREIVAALKD